VDKIDQYRSILKKIILEYASYKPSHGRIDTEAIIDPQNDHYEVTHVGWDGLRRVHGSVIHLDIIGDKIWIQHDGTSRPVAEELLAAGVSKDSIVLGFIPDDEREYTDFAVA